MLQFSYQHFTPFCIRSAWFRFKLLQAESIYQHHFLLFARLLLSVKLLLLHSTCLVMCEECDQHVAVAQRKKKWFCKPEIWYRKPGLLSLHAPKLINKRLIAFRVGFCSLRKRLMSEPFECVKRNIGGSINGSRECTWKSSCDMSWRETLFFDAWDAP